MEAAAAEDPSGPSWAGPLVAAAASGRLSWDLVWDLLLAVADGGALPNVRCLLEHAVEPHAPRSHASERALEAAGWGRRTSSGEDWFVIAESLGAAS